MDSISPDCETGAGCLIPKLDSSGRRALQLRSLIVSLHDLVDAGTILQVTGSDLEDLALLAIIEDELKQHGGNEEGAIDG